MRARIVPILSALAIAFSQSLISLNSSTALNFNSSPIKTWGSLYADKSQLTAPSQPRAPRNSEVERKSEWRINYFNVPSAPKKAIEGAVAAWSENYSSKIPVSIDVYWQDEKDSTLLGSARPGFHFNSFPGAPSKDLWYPSALANELSGRDLDPNQSEILLKLNSSVFWHFDLDSPPSRQSYDLFTVVLHEIAHGLGLFSNVEFDRISSTGSVPQPTPFDALVQLPNGKALYEFCSRTSTLGTVLTGDLFWSGNEGREANNAKPPKLYTPAIYSQGSSLVHLDESVFEQDALLTPRLEAGEFIQTVGPIVLGMIEDLKSANLDAHTSKKPNPPINVQALTGDKYALITFESGDCTTTSRASKYKISVSPGGITRDFRSSPARFDGLKNGTSYTFSIVAENRNGSSERVNTNVIKLQRSNLPRVIDSSSKVKNFSTITWRGTPTIIYFDQSTGRLKLAAYKSSRWIIASIHSNNKVGKISLCKQGEGENESLHIIYSDLENGDLVHGFQKNSKWRFEIIDGDGPTNLSFKEKVRSRTASDVSASNACVVTSNILQVFYREATQGLLLGASKTSAGWVYEVVDGDRDSGGRTTGDLALALAATSVGSQTWVLYDSILNRHSSGKSAEGEVRLAVRNSIFPEDWRYSTLDGPKTGSAVAGYSVAISNSDQRVHLGWFATSGIGESLAKQVKYTTSEKLGYFNTLSTLTYGEPGVSVSIDDEGLVFGCQSRLCKTSKTNSVDLLTGKSRVGINSLLRIERARYAISTIRGKLVAIKL